MRRRVNRGRSRLQDRIALVALAAVAALIPLTPGAAASVTSQTIAGEATPTTQSATALGAASLRIDLDAAYDSYDPPTPAQSGAVIHLDDDFAYDTTGLATCDPATIDGQASADAIAACSEAQVGSGFATGAYSLGSFPGAVTAFNATPSGDDPTLVLHLDFGFGGRVAVPGVVGTSSRGGDFGTQIAFANLGAPSGFAITHVHVTLFNREPSPGHHPISARCSDGDETWNYAGDFGYADLSTNQASDTQSCATSTPPPATPPPATSPPPKKKRSCRKAKKGAAASKKKCRKRRK